MINDYKALLSLSIEAAGNIMLTTNANCRVHPLYIIQSAEMC